MLKQPCPLCAATVCVFYFKDKKREYFQCETCKLIFVPRCFHLSKAEEKAEYDKHENAIDDEGYLRFLSRCISPLLSIINTSPSVYKKGIDFGCGPAPALAHEVRRQGYDMSIYDPYYFPDHEAIQRKYDFVTCTEVVEHFNEPAIDIAQLFSLLAEPAVLIVMTKLVINKERFASWHYKNDPTHVCFYSKETFEFIALQHKVAVEFIGSDVILFVNG
ncbi:class I SAM-dependent methyltransferase [Agaribacter marinus]|nr:class I SAM-dependent methyltransferase [Agaribacter marinus]